MDSRRPNQVQYSQTAYPSEAYVDDILGVDSVSLNPTDYSQSTLMSPESEQSSMQPHDPRVGADFIYSIPAETAQKLGETYAEELAHSYPALQPRSECGPLLLSPHWSNQSGSGAFINNTAADIRRSRSPSAASRMSDGRISRTRRQLPTSRELRPPYICQFCDKEFNIPSDRK